jgi:hypothetical protein
MFEANISAFFAWLLLRISRMLKLRPYALW